MDIIVKKSSCVFLPASFLHASFCVRLSLLLLSRYDTANEYITFVRFGACVSRVLQGFKTNLVTVNGSLKYHNTTSTRRTRKNAGIERSKNNNKKQNKTRTNEQQTDEQTDAKRKKEKKERKEEGNVLEEKKKEKKKKTRNKNKPATEKRKEKKTGNVSGLLIHVTSISLCYLN